MSEERIEKPYTSDINSPELIGEYKFNSKLEFKRIYLKQNTVSFHHKNIVNLYITYELDAWPKD